MKYSESLHNKYHVVVQYKHTLKQILLLIHTGYKT